MIKKIIRFTPDQLGYVDRGKVKWQGLMLSDHSESLKRSSEKEKEADIQAKAEQSLAEISEILSEAYLKKKPVAIQANIMQNGSYFKDVPCIITGFLEEKIFLLLKEGRIVDTTLEDIRNIEFIQPEIWYQKRYFN